MGYNQLCGVNEYGKGTYTSEGITKLCEGLKGRAVPSLRCATPRAPERSLLRQRPLILSTVRRSCSLQGNQIGYEGTSALAAILSEINITNLECAAA